jgi:hydroxyacylglutathione hydrolase
MNIKCFSTGLFESNCYVLSHNNECVIIDAGVDVLDISDYITQHNLTVKYIFLTHGHIDHIVGVNTIKDKFGGEIVIHSSDADMLTNPSLNLSAKIVGEKSFYPADIILDEPTEFVLGDLTIQTINTPGHTKGGVCYKVENQIFTGDTLFHLSIGRTDLSGGDLKEIFNSIKNKLFTLDDSDIVNPGHGLSSTIGAEKKHNPYVGNKGL